MVTKPKETRQSGLGSAVRDKVVTVEVGPERTKYIIHAPLLTQHSEYFKKALTGQWKEAKEGVIAIEDVDCETYEIFVDWLYTQQIRHHDDAAKRVLLEFKACVFGDRFLASGFWRTVHDGIVDHIAGTGVQVTYEAIVYAFDNFREDNPILQLLVDMQCLRCNSQLFGSLNGGAKKLQSFPRAFLTKVIERYSDIGKGKSYKINRCDYHYRAPVTAKKIVAKPVPDQSTQESDGESDSDSENETVASTDGSSDSSTDGSGSESE